MKRDFSVWWCTYTNMDGLHSVDDGRPHEDDDIEATQQKKKFKQHRAQRHAAEKQMKGNTIIAS